MDIERKLAVIVLGAMPASFFCLVAVIPGLYISTAALFEEGPEIVLLSYVLWNSAGLIGTGALWFAGLGAESLWIKLGLLLGIAAMVPVLLGYEDELIPRLAVSFRGLAILPVVAALVVLVSQIESNQARAERLR